jgi:septal ring factor EnvC (AmiA/AmiB activator)
MLSLPQAVLKNLIPLLGLAALALSSPGAGAWAADTEAGLRRDAAEVDRRLKEARESARDLGDQARGLADELDRMERDLNRARRNARRTRAELDRLDARLAEAEAAFDQLSGRLRDRRDRAATRAASLYKLHAVGAVHLLASAGSVGEFFERRTALRRVLDRDRRLLDQLSVQQAELDLLSGEIEIARRKRAAAAADHRAAAAALEKRRKKRKRMLARVRTEEALAAEAVAALREAAAALDRRLAALRRRRPTPVQGGAFARHKGLLNMPATGKITTFFGPFEHPEFGVRNFHSGIVIRAEVGAPIQSVGEGEVIYADWFKGYGNMIIIDHGDHYYTLYAHAGELYKAKGDAVKTGEVIAAVGGGGALDGPGLHFEVRHHGKPLDPMDWLKETG